MPDFETHPVGTRKRIQEILEVNAKLTAVYVAATAYRDLWYNAESTQMKSLCDALDAAKEEL